MPRVGWLVNGKPVTDDEALETAKRNGHFFRIPPSVWVALIRQTKRVDGWWLSPSSSTSCPRHRILRATEPYLLDPQKVWAAMMGSFAHNGFETGHQHEELRLRLDLDVPVFSDDGVEGMVRFPAAGTLDKYEEEQRRITDYKSISDFVSYDTVQKKRVAKVLPDPRHEAQINVYRLLADANELPVEEAMIFYFKTDKSAARKVVPVKLWSLEDAYLFAVKAAQPLAQARETSILPPCSCEYPGWGMDRDLCAEVTNEEWIESGGPERIRNLRR